MVLDGFRIEEEEKEEEKALQCTPGVGGEPLPPLIRATSPPPPRLLKVKVSPYIKRLAFSSKLSHRQCDNSFFEILLCEMLC